MTLGRDDLVYASAAHMSFVSGAGLLEFYMEDDLGREALHTPLWILSRSAPIEVDRQVALLWLASSAMRASASVSFGKQEPP